MRRDGSPFLRRRRPQECQLWVEVGCGKGKFTAETAEANPDVLLIAVERVQEAIRAYDHLLK